MNDAWLGDPRSPVLILCAPRSFSSVVCAMLGQHSEMYVFPELNLFLTGSVGELLQLDDRMSHVTGRQGASYTPGLTRAVAQLLFRTQSEDALVRSLAWLGNRARWSASRMLGHLLRLVEPRIGVEKSPRTCLSTRALQRALAFHAGTRFLHLTRDPLNTIHSIVESLTAGAPSGVPACSTEDRKRFAVRLWCFCQQTILRETAAVPSRRFLRVRGEDLLNHADTELPPICRWIGIRDDTDAIQAMLHPERSPFARLGACPSGGDQDAGFLASPRLRPARSPSTPDSIESWNLEHQDKFAILALARLLGYADRVSQDVGTGRGVVLK